MRKFGRTEIRGCSSLLGSTMGRRRDSSGRESVDAPREGRGGMRLQGPGTSRGLIFLVIILILIVAAVTVYFLLIAPPR